LEPLSDANPNIGSQLDARKEKLIAKKREGEEEKL
jgi:hypothetical protein